MMTDGEVRALIVCLLDADGGSHFNNHRDGQLRALLAVLTRERPPIISGDTGDLFDLAGIPYTRNEQEGTVEIPDDWLREHGFDVDGDGRHPEWSTSW